MRVWVRVWVGVRVSGWDMKWFYDDEPISTTKIIIRWRGEELHSIPKGLSQISQRPDMSTPKTDAVYTIDLGVDDGEEHRLIDVGNEICFYFSFCCCILLLSIWSRWEHLWFNSKNNRIPCGNGRLFFFSRGLYWVLNSSHLWSLSDWFRSRNSWGKDEMLLPCQWTTVFLFIVENNDINELGIANPERSMKLIGCIFLRRIWLNSCRSPLSRSE